MYSENPPAADEKASSETAGPKPVWEVILTTTPVVLTVLGTILAGLSNSEMTKAQYYRTLAAQTQSKVADQWGFYQAKRIRGTTLEAMVDLLPLQAHPGKGRSAVLITALLRVQRREKAAFQAAEGVVVVVGKSRAELPDEIYRSLAGWSKELVQIGQANVKKLPPLLEECVNGVAGRPDVQRALKLVNENKWDADETAVAGDDGPLAEALAALKEGKSEVELARLVQRVPPSDLKWATDTAEANAHNLTAALARSSVPMDQLHATIRDLLQGMLAFHEHLERFDELLVGNDKLRLALPARFHDALAQVQLADGGVMAAGEDLKHVAAGIEHTFTSRRYRLEADRNQQIAYLYEVQIRLDSQAADRHRTRSVHFFYGLLCAQAGVAISSLALAARQRSVLWGLAGLAGLTALGFSLYVYLYV
jgi:hypothetical protein